MTSAVTAPARPKRIALAGNPNAGKTTLFNALTGLRQKVGNYPGVTVDKMEGKCRLPSGSDAVIVDLPGTYSLVPKSPDEEIARDILLGLRSDVAAPDVVIVVVDASNLERNLYLATQILELGLPTVVALNMTDVAAAAGRAVNAAKLSQELGCPVVEVVAVRGEGLPALKEALASEIPFPTPPRVVLPSVLEDARNRLSTLIAESVGQFHDHGSAPVSGGEFALPEGHGTEAYDSEVRESGGLLARGAALRLMGGNAPLDAVEKRFGQNVANALREIQLDRDARPGYESGPRYKVLHGIAERVTHHAEGTLPRSFTDRADAVLTHRFWGLVFFAAITYLVFQAIYTFAQTPMNWISSLQSHISGVVIAHMADGPFRDMLVDGVINGVGTVMTFIPQILILFFFIGILEDSGYMARAAFIMDRMMSKVGLHGRAFIPLLSSFACAIPGILATRTIASRRDRMTTILIAPLMSCSARIPVYTLMIGTFIPETRVFGVLSSRALTMFSMYVLGVVIAMAAAWVFKRTLFQGPVPTLMIELPAYKTPAWRNVVQTMWARGSEFTNRAGTVIFAMTILLWFVLAYPRLDVTQLPKNYTPEQVAGARIHHSLGGQMGHWIEPVIAPLGFNWKVGIGLVGAMAARESFVSTMGTVYSVGSPDDDPTPLHQAMRDDRWPDGRKVWTPLAAISLLVYFVIAMQCVSTLGIVKRETESWGWPLFMFAYMTGLAWIMSFLVFQGGRLLGWG